MILIFAVIEQLWMEHGTEHQGFLMTWQQNLTFLTAELREGGVNDLNDLLTSNYTSEGRGTKRVCVRR